MPFNNNTIFSLEIKFKKFFINILVIVQHIIIFDCSQNLKITYISQKDN